ncbi:MAG: glycosyltransferase, partial [Acidimicrobiales bacterium]
MIIFGTCVGNEERYRTVALPSIERVAGTEDLIWSRSGERGIGAAYNEMILAARDVAGCQALVVLHEDVQIVDDNFRPKLLKSLGHNVGLVGVVGASRLKGLAWWDARCTAGLVYETRGVIDFGTRRADV